MPKISTPCCGCPRRPFFCAVGSRKIARKRARQSSSNCSHAFGGAICFAWKSIPSKPLSKRLPSIPRCSSQSGDRVLLVNTLLCLGSSYREDECLYLHVLWSY